MQIKMHYDFSSLKGLILSIGGWLAMKLFMLLQLPNLAQFSSFCVIIGVMWTFIANADKSVTNIEKFVSWIKLRIKISNRKKLKRKR